MKLILPKVQCWNCPEGNYPATCVGVREVTEVKNGKPVHLVQLVFEIDVGEDDNVRYLAKRRYELPVKAGSKLLDDLTGWLGEAFLRNHREFDPATLKGRQADLVLVHIHNEGYEKPWVHIESIHAAGSLVQMEESPPPSPRLLRLEDIR